MVLGSQWQRKSKVSLTLDRPEGGTTKWNPVLGHLPRAELHIEGGEQIESLTVAH